MGRLPAIPPRSRSTALTDRIRQRELEAARAHLPPAPCPFTSTSGPRNGLGSRPNQASATNTTATNSNISPTTDRATHGEINIAGGNVDADDAAGGTSRPNASSTSQNDDVNGGGSTSGTQPFQFGAGETENHEAASQNEFTGFNASGLLTQPENANTGASQSSQSGAHDAGGEDTTAAPAEGNTGGDDGGVVDDGDPPEENGFGRMCVSRTPDYTNSVQ